MSIKPSGWLGLWRLTVLWMCATKLCTWVCWSVVVLGPQRIRKAAAWSNASGRRIATEMTRQMICGSWSWIFCLNKDYEQWRIEIYGLFGFWKAFSVLVAWFANLLVAYVSGTEFWQVSNVRMQSDLPAYELESWMWKEKYWCWISGRQSYLSAGMLGSCLTLGCSLE